MSQRNLSGGTAFLGACPDPVWADLAAKWRDALDGADTDARICSAEHLDHVHDVASSPQHEMEAATAPGRTDRQVLMLGAQS